MNKGMMLRVVSIAVMVLGGGMSACAMSGTNWKEEVLLHDGRKIIVERSLNRKGRHEPFQPPSIGEQSLSFVLPATHQRVRWNDEYSEDLGSANFLPMMLEIDKDAAYLVVLPMGCLSYNKWGRPNPPYVVFKHRNEKWHRIALQELPARFKTPNLIISSPDEAVKKTGLNLIPAETVSRINNAPVAAGSEQPHLKQILREPLASSQLCPPELTGFKAPYPIPPKSGGAGGK